MKCFILPALLFASPLIAEPMNVFAVQKDGSGVIQYESQATWAETEVLIGTPRPAGATGVVLKDGGRVEYTSQSPTAVNEKYGGSGEPFIINADDSEIEFDPEEERRNQETGEAPSEMAFDENKESQAKIQTMQTCPTASTGRPKSFSQTMTQ